MTCSTRSKKQTHFKPVLPNLLLSVKKALEHVPPKYSTLNRGRV